MKENYNSYTSGGMINEADNSINNFYTDTSSTHKTFWDFVKEDKSPMVYCIITIDGKEFTGSRIVEIMQYTNNHDSFTITTPDNSFDSFQGYVMENSKHLTGKDVTVDFWRFGKQRQSFRGIVAKIGNKKNEGGGYGDLLIAGYAPSILLESGKDCQSFEDKTLEQIISEICSGYPQEAKIKAETLNTKYNIPYTVQYKETDYQFIKRLAVLYGEYFYYNGENLIFGNKVQPSVKLGEGIDLIDVEFELNVKPQDFGYISYDTVSGQNIAKDSSQVQKQYKENPFQAILVNSSKKIFKKKPQMHFNHTGISEGNEHQLQEAVRKERENRENLVLVKGRSRDPELRIGSLAEISDINSKAMETYRIIDIKHYHDGYEYYNEFTGIPDLFNPPYQDNDAVPFGEIQSARVVDNNDPMGAGRVRVQFAWQMAKNQKTKWIHLIQPHSGAGKGFYFIPEIGEEVLVGYESENAEKPFVMGTKYNGKETSGYHTAGNDIKVIRTRSGIENISNDAEGSWKQSTPDGNFLHFDGKGNATLNIPKNLTINVGENMAVNVLQNMNQVIGINSFITAGTNITMNTPEMKQYITDYFHTQAGKALINSENEIKIEAKETNVSGFEKIFLHSDSSTIINSKGTVEVKGQEGTSNTNIAEIVVKELPLVDTKVIAHFRPKREWKGEFGFCYYREKNKEISDSEDYSKLIGKYYQFKDRELLDENIEHFQALLDLYYTEEERQDMGLKNVATSYLKYYIRNDNKWYKERTRLSNSRYIETVQNFKNDPQYLEVNNTLQTFKDQYSAFIYSKKGKEDKETKKPTIENVVYHGSYIALFPKTARYGVCEATIDLEISILEKDGKPDYLIFKVDNQKLTADNAFIGINRLKIDKPEDKETIVITCKTAQNFTTNKKIEVYAVKVQEDKTETETLAGCITMIAPVIRNLNVAIVGVKTKATEIGVLAQYGAPVQNWLAFFKKSLGQALIKVNIIETHNSQPIRLDISATPNFSTTFGVATDGTITQTDGLKNLLNTKFEADYATIPNTHFRLFFIDVTCGEAGDEGGKTLGFSRYGWTCGLMFDGHTTATISHECLHAMGLPHSFFHRNSSYVFKAMETNNIMDYSHMKADPVSKSERTSKERYYTLKWQWEIVRRYNLLTE